MSPAYNEEGILHSAKGIPVRNIWLLMLYASGCFSEIIHKNSQVDKEKLPEDWADLIAEILVHFVRERLLRGLTRNSAAREADLRRVRGSIDMLRTARRCLLERGQVACRFYEPTLNTPRNRVIRAALEKGAVLARGHVADECREYAELLFRMGVLDGLPDKYTLSRDVDTLNNRDDRKVMAAAHLLLDMALPQTRQGVEFLPLPQVNDTWLRGLFERAVRGFYRAAAENWDVAKSNVSQNWPDIRRRESSRNGCSAAATPGIEDYFPEMKLDIVLHHRQKKYKIVIDTKFTSLLKQGWYRDKSFSSAYIYQMYTYLRTQEGQSDADDTSTGILLHPALEESQLFSCTVQGHYLIFATVNLNAPAQEIHDELLKLLDDVEKWYCSGTY